MNNECNLIKKGSREKIFKSAKALSAKQAMSEIIKNARRTAFLTLTKKRK